MVADLYLSVYKTPSWYSTLFYVVLLLLLYCCLGGGTTLSAQGLILDLYSEIIPGEFGIREEPGLLSSRQGSYLQFYLRSSQGHYLKVRVYFTAEGSHNDINKADDDEEDNDKQHYFL